MSAKASAPAAKSEVAELPAVTGPCLVTIISSGPIVVINEMIVDRERHENGRHPLAAQQTGHYVVTEGQSLRVVNGH